MTKKIYLNILSLLLSTFLIMAGYVSADASGNYTFAQSSLLSAGYWVKIRVPETGIYEISYSKLMEMGFSDPSKVSVYGKGGTALPINFTDGIKPIITDDLRGTAVWHHNDKIYFYGRATEDIAFNPSSVQYEKKSLNIYALDGVYFLTDSGTINPIEMKEKPEGNIFTYSSGYDYVYHEKDLYHNTTETGQLFWGENLLESSEGLSWSFSLPLLDTSVKSRLECKVFAADKTTGNFKYGITGASSGNRSFTIKHPAAASGNKINPEFLHMNNPVISLALTSTDVNLYTKAENAAGSFLNLDYWILTYAKKVPDFSLSESSQERFAIKTKGNKPGIMIAPSASDVAVFDITDPDSISLLHSEITGLARSFYFDTPVGYREFMFCDLSKKQKEISGYDVVNNSDLHARASQGADYIIFTTLQYKDFSERLADLHRRHNGIDVIVAVANDVYNEFSGGLPDPMAFRAFTKMCYEAEGSGLKNVLFVGKFYGNYRKVLSEMDHDDFLIGFQDVRVNADTHAAHAMDFFGFTDDVVYSSLQNNAMQVGVGLLPFHSLEEAESYLKKAERYMTDENKADYCNEFLSIGGLGDNHTHDIQGNQLSDYWSIYSPPGQNNEVLALDAYGEKEAKKKLMENLNNGKLFTSYFGHGTAFGINSSYDFFRVADIALMKNNKSGFMLICACDLSDTDHARKGFGEILVTGTPYGMLGSIMATRTVWSGQNYEFAKLVSSVLYVAPDKVADPANPTVMRTVYRLKSPTIGEAFARAKTLSNYSNSLAYIYIGDPALTIPVPLRRIIAETVDKKVLPGEKIRLKGTVSLADSVHLRDTLPIDSYSLPKDPKYTGKIVIKLRQKESKRLSNDYITNTKKTGKELYVKFPGEKLAEYRGEVKNGEFDIEVTIPKSMMICEGDSLSFSISAYDNTRDLSASGLMEVTVGKGENVDNNISLDLCPPVIISNHDVAANTILITVTDDGNLPANALIAEIDNRPATPILTDSKEEGRREYMIFTDLLSEGEHTLSMTARDIASNMSESSFSFTKESNLATIGLSSDRKTAIDEIDFVIDESADISHFIYITDSNDMVIFKDKMEGNHYKWNCNNAFGGHVSPGLYRAFVRSSDSSSFSSKLTFAIIE